MSILTQAVLPQGYDLIQPGTIMEHTAQGIVTPRLDLKLRDILDAEPRGNVPSYSLYGGATITEVWDAQNTRYMGCDARDPSGWFGFHVFADKGSGSSNVPLQYKATGRGSVNGNAYARLGEWVAWEGSNFLRDMIPGFVTFDASGGAGGTYVALVPSLWSAAYDGQLTSGGLWIDIPAVYHAPPGSAYYMRIVCKATKVDIRARLGSEQEPGAASVNTQVANVQEHQGWMVSATNNRLYFSVADGNGQLAQANVWLKVAGYVT